MKNRAFTFASYNAHSLPSEMFFVVRSVADAKFQFRLRPQQDWNDRRLRELERSEDLWALVNDAKHPVVAPRKVELTVHAIKAKLPTSEDVLYVAGLLELRKQLRIGSLERQASAALITKGQRLKLSSKDTKSNDHRQLGHGGGRKSAAQQALPHLGMLESSKFQLEPGEVRACTVRVDVPDDRVTVLHVEQWRGGGYGDRARPVGDLTFVFPAEGQLKPQRKPEGA